jgi:hypothetical protein
MRERAVFVFFCLCTLAACSTGCMYANPPGTPVTLSPAPVIAGTPLPAAPVTVITVAPAKELARIRQESLGVGIGTGSLYQYRGSLAISGGAYSSVKVILHYPDGTDYVFDAGSMGGASPVVKPVVLYPDSRYQGQTPDYLISLDGKEYATVYQYTDGTIYRIASTDSAVPVSP